MGGRASLLGLVLLQSLLSRLLLSSSLDGIEEVRSSSTLFSTLFKRAVAFTKRHSKFNNCMLFITPKICSNLDFGLEPGLNTSERILSSVYVYFTLEL